MTLSDDITLSADSFTYVSDI